jgi:hypothetical protein
LLAAQASPFTQVLAHTSPAQQAPGSHSRHTADATHMPQSTPLAEQPKEGSVVALAHAAPSQQG